MQNSVLNEDLMERLMTDPPPVDDVMLADLYDQSMWVAKGQPMVVCTGDVIESGVGAGLSGLAFQLSRAARRATPVNQRRFAHTLGVQFELIPEMLKKMRRFHLFAIDSTPMGVVGKSRVYLVPPNARKRLQDPRLALVDMPSPAEVAEALRRRYASP